MIKKEGKPQVGPVPIAKIDIKTRASSRESTTGEIISKMSQAKQRDDVIDLALKYLLRFCGRSIFFAIKKGNITGFDIAGSFTNRDAIRSFWIPLTSASTLQRVGEEKRIYFGLLDDTPADRVMCAALGEKPDNAVILPVVINDRTIGMLYADRISIDKPPWQKLERLISAVSDNLLRIIKDKGKK